MAKTDTSKGSRSDSNPKKDQTKSKVTADHSSQSLQKKDENVNLWNTNSLIWLFVVSAVSIITRFYRLDRPNEVVFDEVHFGKYASEYIKREYFFDVHPPIGKLLFAAVGYLFGYDGSFSFEKIGLSYLGTNVPYVDMRSFAALCGSLIVIVVYAMLIEMKFSLPVAILGASLLAFDNALTTQSRFILLDSQLICYTVMTCFCWVKFRALTKQPFSSCWWFWLFATGSCIGMTLGVKLIGLFITAAIGVCTFVDLWDIMDPKKTKEELTVAFHWLARIVCLIALPVIIFLGAYWVHFNVANHTGSGDKYMSNEFQATLKGSFVADSTTHVFYGNMIKIVNEAEKTFLHSSEHRYPLKHSDGKISSQGQIVAGHREPHEDNDWMILPAITNPPIDYKNKLIPVKNGDLIRLLHLSTEKFLASHDVASPLTLTNQEVTALDVKNTSSKDYPATLWTINLAKGNELKSKLSTFQLIHNMSNTKLLNSKDMLPDWGFKMREINSGRVNGPGTWWLVDGIVVEVDEDETNSTNTTAATEKNTSQPAENKNSTELENRLTFWEKFVELMWVSFEANSKLTDKSPYLTPPGEWPLLTRGISFWVSQDKTEKVYLLGNPLTWFMSLLSLPLFVGLVLVDQYERLRGRKLLSEAQKKFVYPKGLFFLLCYLLHYLPFFFMERVLYFHHYLPAYLFNALIFTTFYQMLAIEFKVLSKPAVIAVICSVIAGFFYYFSALVYASHHNEEYFNKLRWFGTWHFQKLFQE